MRPSRTTAALWVAGFCWLSAPALSSPSSVAVLDFTVVEAAGGSERWAWARGGLADLLQIQLQQQGVVLLDRDVIHSVLNEQRLAASGVIADKQLSLARLLNAQFWSRAA